MLRQGPSLLDRLRQAGAWLRSFLPELGQAVCHFLASGLISNAANAAGMVLLISCCCLKPCHAHECLQACYCQQTQRWQCMARHCPASRAVWPRLCCRDHESIAVHVYICAAVYGVGLAVVPTAAWGVSFSLGIVGLVADFGLSQWLMSRQSGSNSLQAPYRVRPLSQLLPVTASLPAGRVQRAQMAHTVDAVL